MSGAWIGVNASQVGDGPARAIAWPLLALAMGKGSKASMAASARTAPGDHLEANWSHWAIERGIQFDGTVPRS